MAEVARSGPTDGRAAAAAAAKAYPAWRKLPAPKRVLGRHKWHALGIPYTLEGVEPPPAATMDRIRHQLERRGLKVG